MSTWLLICLLAAAALSLLHYDYRQFRAKADAEDRFEKSVRQWEEREGFNTLAEDSHSHRNEDRSRL